MVDTYNYKCIIYEYVEVSSAATGVHKYGLYCPLKMQLTAHTKLTCTNLLIPYDDGLRYKGSWAGVSTNTGDLVAYHRDGHLTNGIPNHFGPNVLTLNSPQPIKV